MNRQGKWYIGIWVAVIVMMGCRNNRYEKAKLPTYDLTLVWNKAYEDDTFGKSKIGLRWALSYIGAALPANEQGIQPKDSTFILKVNKLGLRAEAQKYLLRLHETIRSSEEYTTMGGIDMGRYVTLILGSPEHYYALTGMPNELSGLLADYDLGPHRGYVNNSGVALEHRIIQFSEQRGFDQLFISSEIDSISRDTLEFETVDILPNGQPRFGIFDPSGKRRNSADRKHSLGGKPSKCIWCHESGIQPMFKKQQSMEGFLTYEQFQDTLWKFKKSHRSLQEAQKEGVDYSKKQEHTLTELLYISFMEPSATRLSLEWRMPLEEVEQKLAHLKTHIHHEFPFLGDLYHRKEIESLAPFKGLKVPGDVREATNVEVNYMNTHAEY